ncbi:MAG: cbb3-type cytochrome oxidase assembly protein CcoS [Myxococcaceae bacterium]|nr:cbb3-type cytochrome oxidase assembly protein CcoS [Myxococcaceae bacterium]
MSVLLLQVFVSLMLVAISVAFFVWSVRRREPDHADRLSLAPLEDERTTLAPSNRRTP